MVRAELVAGTVRAGRLWRQGQKETVVIHHLVVKGTMDEQVMRALREKAADQNALLAAVKARIQEVK